MYTARIDTDKENGLIQNKYGGMFQINKTDACSNKKYIYNIYYIIYKSRS